MSRQVSELFFLVIKGAKSSNVGATRGDIIPMLSRRKSKDQRYTGWLSFFISFFLRRRTKNKNRYLHLLCGEILSFATNTSISLFFISIYLVIPLTYSQDLKCHKFTTVCLLASRFLCFSSFISFRFCSVLFCSVFFSFLSLIFSHYDEKYRTLRFMVVYLLIKKTKPKKDPKSSFINSSTQHTVQYKLPDPCPRLLIYLCIVYIYLFIPVILRLFACAYHFFLIT